MMESLRFALQAWRAAPFRRPWGALPTTWRGLGQLTLLACAAWPLATPVHAQESATQCGPLSNSFGPFDYRTVRGNQLHLVESAHFTPSIEMLVRGKSGAIGAELDYTLRAFPNHHRALLSMMRYGERLKVPKVPKASLSVECYFVRAVSFQPDDAVARMLFGRYLLNAGRRDEALKQLAVCQPLAGDNPFTHFNLGMSFLEAGDYAQALKHAHRALALGFPRTELKDGLQAKGQWQEPVPADAATPASAGAAASAAAAGASSDGQTPPAASAGAAATAGSAAASSP